MADEPMTGATPTTPERPPAWRSAAGTYALLGGALIAAVGLGSFALVSGSPVTSALGVDTDDDSVVSTSESTATTTSTTSVTETTTAAADVPFTAAAAGDCLTWENDPATGEVRNFSVTDCAGEHRFEVSARQDLSAYPASEFGPNAERPDPTRQAQLREELCQNSTMRYVNGRLDPVGRYSVASILPPAEAWEAGDRTLLCGVQSTDTSGQVLTTVGPIAANDQARVAQPGECLRIDSANSIFPVPCAEDHQVEITAIVDLLPHFPDSTPSVEEQDGLLRDVCTEAAIDYLGEEENLYQSTLQPFWFDLQPSSWNGGSHSVNCGLIFSTEEGLATLAGTATGGREAFTINGEPPAPQPEREPLREPFTPPPTPVTP